MWTNLRKFSGWVLVGMCVNTALAAEVQESGSLAETIKSHQGEIVLLDFWASWCGPCRRSFPWMNKMLTKYQDDGLVIIGVNLDKSHEDARQFLAENSADFEVFFDPDGTTAQDYEVRTMPTSFLLDRNGKVLTRHQGFLTARESIYEHSLAKALALPSQLAVVPKEEAAQNPVSETNHKVSYEN